MNKKHILFISLLFLLGTGISYSQNVPNSLTDKEKSEGYTLLFNGKNLDGWTGNKKSYVVEEDHIVIRPVKGGGGNLYTEKEYADFIFRFEFKLTPGANNGLGIRAPKSGNAAYDGIELQIIDNTTKKYGELESYQYHGSLYGVTPAKRGFQKPVGEWNQQEVFIQGTNLKVTLNGHVILDTNFQEAIENGTMDHQEHPGLQRDSGHIGFLGHGDVVRLRNIRIREL